MQGDARSNNLSLDVIVLRTSFTNVYEVSGLGEQPAAGVFGHGLFMEGAGWEDGKGDEEGFALRSWLHIMHSVSFSMIPFTLLGHAVVKR